MSDNVISNLTCSTPTKVRIALAATEAHTYEDFAKLTGFLDTLDRAGTRRYFELARLLLSNCVFEKIKYDAVAYMSERDARNEPGK